ncbi:retention in endoplasmic reticulum protein 1 [Dionaea muscipula]
MPICSLRLNPSGFQSQFASNEAILLGIRRSHSFVAEIRTAAPKITKAALGVEGVHHPWREEERLRVKAHESLESTLKTALVSDESRVLGDDYVLGTDDGGSGVGNGGIPRENGGDRGGGGGRGDEGAGGEDEEGKEFGSVLKFGEVMRECEKRGASLPSDMLEAAKTTGIRELILDRYLHLQGSAWPLGFLVRHCSMLRNRMLADPAFLFKVGTEAVIDSCCATFAEVQKRGEDFWAEFELYLADVLHHTPDLGVNVYREVSLERYNRLAALFLVVWDGTSIVCTTVKPLPFSSWISFYDLFAAGVLYGLVGFGCGIIGQGIANLIMTAKRKMKKSDEDIPVPPLVRSAALWGVFLGVSSNTRYQVVTGLEQLVEASPLAKKIPPIAMAFTVGIRFANNTYGGMQFVDWAKWSGVQ